MLKPYLPVLLVLLAVLSPIQGASFPSTEAKTIGGNDFQFPTDALKNGVALFAIAMGTSRENGEVQQQQLLAWQEYLDATDSPLREFPLYHFPIIEAPGFIHGVIRRGIAKSYEGSVLPDRAAVIFIKDTKRFSQQSSIPIDDAATMTVVRPDGTISGFVKGAPTRQSLSRLEHLAGIRP